MNVPLSLLISQIDFTYQYNQLQAIACHPVVPVKPVKLSAGTSPLASKHKELIDTAKSNLAVLGSHHHLARGYDL